MCNAIGLSDGAWEGGVSFQAQKALQCCWDSLPGAHIGLRQSVSQQTGGVGFQGAWAWLGTQAMS